MKGKKIFKLASLLLVCLSLNSSVTLTAIANDTETQTSKGQISVNRGNNGSNTPPNSPNQRQTPPNVKNNGNGNNMTVNSRKHPQPMVGVKPGPGNLPQTGQLASSIFLVILGIITISMSLLALVNHHFLKHQKSRG